MLLMTSFSDTGVVNSCEDHFPERPVNGKKEQYVWTNYQLLSLSK